jgi:DNA repair protein RadC
MDLSKASASALVPPTGPRERALEEGIAALGDADLLAVLLGTGLAGRSVSLVATGVLERFSGLEGLVRVSPAAIAEHPGVGIAKALRISAALELGRRAARRAARPRGALQTSLSVVGYLQPMLGPIAHEEMWLLALDGKNQLRSARRVAQGGLHACIVAPRDIFRAALTDAATAIVLAHNHPSGDPTPSASDTSMTRMFADLGSLLGLPLVDHVILTPDGQHSSMLNLGILEPAG